MIVFSALRISQFEQTSPGLGYWAMTKALSLHILGAVTQLNIPILEQATTDLWEMERAISRTIDKDRYAS